MRPAALFLAAVFAATAAHGQDKKDEPKPDPAKPLEFTGRLEAAVVEIRPRVTGYLSAVAVKDGATVKKGDLLAEIDPRPYKAEFDAARARVALAEAQAKLAEANYARIKAVAAKGVVTVEEVDRAAGEVKVAEAGLAAARAEAARAELNLSWTRLTAPIDGRLGRFHQTAGNLLVADNTLVVTVVQMDPLSVAFDLDERSFLKLRDGLAAGKPTVQFGVANEEGYPHTAAVTFIDSQVDPKTGTVLVRATVPNPKESLYPGLFARVRLTVQPAK
jgi:RND family efflux transporter MFP subunit